MKLEAMSLLNDLLFLLLIPFIIYIVLVFNYSWLFKTSKAKKPLNPPSPPKLPIIGNLHQVGSIPPRSLKSLAEKHGPIMLLHFGTKPVIVISSADAAKEVMRTHDLSFADRPKTYAAKKLLYQFKDMSFCPYGEYWRQIRSISVLQLLSYKRVQSFRGIREEEVAIMVEKIKQSCASSSILNADEIFLNLTNDIVCRAAFGRKFSEEKGGSQYVNKLFRDLTTLLGDFNVGDFIPWLRWVNYVNGFEEKVNRVAKEMDEYLEHVLDGTRKRLESVGDGELNQQSFATVLFEFQRNNANDFAGDRDFVKALILDMIVGGTDTTQALLEWIMVELLRNKSVMIHLKKEVREVVGSKPDITDEDLEKMQYLHAVIKEALRLHPSVPLLVPREARENVNLMGYHVQKGTRVIINAWAIGRDPTYWDEPDEFKPERFLSSSLDFKGLNFHYIPFGSGRRSCPGTTFALGILELALANLMHKFDFELPDGIKGEDLDMKEMAGSIYHKKIPLLFVAKTC